MHKFKSGDKVVPIGKSVWGSLNESRAWKHAQSEGGYLIVRKFDHEEGAYSCKSPSTSGGDFFAEYDLVPYSEEAEIKTNTKEITLGQLITSIQANLVFNPLDLNMPVSEYIEKLQELK